MREIILDTETTGLNPQGGDRLIEIGCIELVNRIPSGREFHRFINPERDVPAEAEAVHGLSTAFLKDKPLFADVAGEFLEFIAGDAIVIHNAAFDVGFLNFELGRLSLGAITMDRVTCTLQLARRRHPAGPNSLDALCKRYGIDNSKRTKHGALVDSLLLAEVYIELLGVRQAAFVGLRHATLRRRSAPSSRRCSAAMPRSVRRRFPRGCRRRWKPRTRRSSRRWARRPSGAASLRPPPTLRVSAGLQLALLGRHASDHAAAPLARLRAVSRAGGSARPAERYRTGEAQSVSSSWFRPRPWSAAPAGGADTATRNRTDRAAAAGSRLRASGRRRCGARTGTGSTGS